MKKHLFSIVEMIVVISIICIILAMSFPYLRDAQVKRKKVVTRNMLQQLNGMISAYYTDYSVLPLSMHVDPSTYNDTTTTEYWKRIPRGLFNVNDTLGKNNAEVTFDLYDNEDGSSKGVFDAKYPSNLISIPLEPWYSGAPNKTKIEQEELSIVAHSSRFLNYYLSGSGFDIYRGQSYHKPEANWLGDYDTSFRLSYEKSALIKPFLYFLINDTITWNGASPEVKQTTIPPTTSYLMDQTQIYFDYVPKIIGNWNSQIYSKNLAEDKLRRLYKYNEDLKPLPKLANKFDSKRVTLLSDRMVYRSNYFGTTSVNDARTAAGLTGNNGKEAKLAKAKADLAAAVAANADAGTIAALQAAVNAAQADVDAANLVVQSTAIKGELDNTNAIVYMRAHTDNVKCIVDAFNTPIVYITYTNQRKEKASTYKFVDLNGNPDNSKDKSMRTDSYVLYSLGQNKMDDSDLGENYMDKKGIGDDIIIMAGEK